MIDVVKGRTVVVTGGANGIGRALAHEAAARGAGHVVIVDISPVEAEAAARSVRTAGSPASAYQADVTNVDELTAVASQIMDDHGVPGLVCANAGVGQGLNNLLDLALHEARWVIDVNLVGVLATLQAFGRIMRDSDHPGRLLVTASEHSFGVPHGGAGMYTATKHAVLGLCDVMRRELPAHLGLSVLCPGLTTSELWRAPTRRPAAYGGPTEASDLARVVMDQGMDPAVVAARALDGVEQGEFLIPTHYNAKAYADARADEVAEGFGRLADVDTSEWHVEDAVATVLASLDPEN